MQSFRIVVALALVPVECRPPMGHGMAGMNAVRSSATGVSSFKSSLMDSGVSACSASKAIR